jgi:hypothetical protein
MPSVTAGVMHRGSSDSLAMFAAIPPDLVAPRSCGHLSVVLRSERSQDVNVTGFKMN